MPPIYYMFSCLQDYFNNSENVEIPLKVISVSPDFVSEYLIVFFFFFFFLLKFIFSMKLKKENTAP